MRQQIRRAIPGDDQLSRYAGAGREPESSLTIRYDDPFEAACSLQDQLFIRITRKVRVGTEFNNLERSDW
jgi:hypothetical protein